MRLHRRYSTLSASLERGDGSEAESEAMKPAGDWREFRASLISRSRLEKANATTKMMQVRKRLALANGSASILHGEIGCGAS